MNSFAGNERNTMGARSAAMGMSGVATYDVFSVLNNPAATTQLEQLSLGLFAENRFLLADVNYGGLAFALPTSKAGTIGLGLSFFGNDLYSERHIALSYGIKLSPSISIGTHIDAYNVATLDDGSGTALTFGLGLQYQIVENARVGMHLHNPLFAGLTEFQEDDLPSFLQIGIAYDPSDKLTLCLEGEKELDQKAIFKMGLEWRMAEKFHLRGGIATQPIYSSLGAGVNLGRLKLDLATSFHPQLGLTPHVSVRFE